MAEDDYQVDYYLLDDGAVARIWYDVDADEYFGGEVLDENSRWQEHPVEEIMADGDEIGHQEARERIIARGGTI